MNEYYAILKDDWLLRGWKDNVHVLLNWRDGRMLSLNEEAFFVASSCDGCNDFESIVFIPKMRRLLDTFVEKGIAKPCAPGQELHPSQRYRFAPNNQILGLLWSITGSCNYKCRHCYIEAPNKKNREPSTDELLAFLEQIEKANVPEIALTGGEPLLRPELPMLIKAIADKRIYLSEIFTNAALITDSLLDVFEQNGFHPHFKVSFDGVGTHDYMRGVKGAEQATLAGIQLLKKRGFPVTIISSMDRVVVQTIQQTFDLMLSLGVDNWWMGPPVEVGNWKGTQTSITPDELVKSLEYVLSRWALENRPFGLKLWRFGRYQTQATGTFRLKLKPPITDEAYNCWAAHLLPCLQPDGTLIPCASYMGWDMTKKMPNIHHMSLSDAWEDKSLRSVCDLRKGEVRMANLSCMECEYFPECGGGCRSVAIAETGEFMKKDPIVCDLFQNGYFQRFERHAEKVENEWRSQYE